MGSDNREARGTVPPCRPFLTISTGPSGSDSPIEAVSLAYGRGVPLLSAMVAPTPRSRTVWACALAALVALPVGAQGTFQTSGPSYGGETARRAFYGGFAVSAEAAYGDGDFVGTPGVLGDLSLAARLDYALLPQVDLAVVADLSGAAQNGRMGLSWVVVKPYWHDESTDYAVRVAVDPQSEGGLGFRQTDVAFFSTTALSPTLTSDVALGLRRVRAGYAPSATEPAADDLAGAVAQGLSAGLLAAVDPVQSLLVGQSGRASWGYNVLFDPAGSRFTVGLAAEIGAYTVIQSSGTVPEEAAPVDPEATETSNRIRRGDGWLQIGAEFSRPQYQLAPFVSLPIATWADNQGTSVREGPRLQKLRVGLRVTLR